MVELNSHLHFKDLEGKAGIYFKTLIGEDPKRELFDTDKILTVDLKERISGISEEKRQFLGNLQK